MYAASHATCARTDYQFKDYVVQSARFDALEIFGCATSIIASGVAILLIQSWTIIFPLVAIIFYYRMYP